MLSIRDIAQLVGNDFGFANLRVDITIASNCSRFANCEQNVGVFFLGKAKMKKISVIVMGNEKNTTFAS